MKNLLLIWVVSSGWLNCGSSPTSSLHCPPPFQLVTVTLSPGKVCGQAWSGVRLPAGLLCTALNTARHLFRIRPSLWAREAVSSSSAFVPVLFSRPLHRSAPCCCSSSHTGPGPASASSSLGFCLGLPPSPWGTPLLAAGAVTNSWCGDNNQPAPLTVMRHGWWEPNEGIIRLKFNVYLCINAALTALSQSHVKSGNHFNTQNCGLVCAVTQVELLWPPEQVQHAK